MNKDFYQPRFLLAHATPIISDKEELTKLMELLQPNAVIHPPRTGAMSLDCQVECSPSKERKDFLDDASILYKDGDSVFISCDQREQTARRGKRHPPHLFPLEPEWKNVEITQSCGRKERRNEAKERKCGFCKNNFVNDLQNGHLCVNCAKYFCCAGCKIIHQCK